MHDYLATDGESSFRPRHEEAEAKRQLYTGQRDKNKVRAMTKTCLFICSLAIENVQIVRNGPYFRNTSRAK